MRAVEGTTAEVAIRPDRPLSTGVILLDDGTKLSLRAAGDGSLVANLSIRRDGMYHFAATEGGEDVRLTEDYIIEAQKDSPPEVKITRPGRYVSCAKCRAIWHDSSIEAQPSDARSPRRL